MRDFKILLDSIQFDITLRRMAHQLIEKYADFSDACIVGIQEKGAILSDAIVNILREELDVDPEYGKIDISFYRDDFRRREAPIRPSETVMDFIIEGKKVVLVDDVLYTGRTIHSAITALQHYGRPDRVEVLTLVDRRFNRHLPIKADYKGIIVDSIDEAYVSVEWAHIQGTNQVKFFGKN